MRILYGIFAQGHGHFSKAAVLLPLLEASGHEVRVVSSGADKPPAGYNFPWHRHFPGLSYVVTNGRTDYRKSVIKWARETPRVMGHLWKLRSLVREFEPDIILSDFEPLTASPFLSANCEVVALSRQVALFDRSIPLPDEMGFERKMTRTAVRLFTSGADRLYGYHYEPASFRCVPPVIRTELSGVQPEDGDHIFVYNQFHTSDGGSAEELVSWARRNRQMVLAYGFSGVERGRQGPVEFRPPHRQGMLDDMRTARAVITTAGLSTPLEAFLLEKPVCTVPIPGHWEQVVNAFHLDVAGIATRSNTWDYDRLLDTAPPSPDHALYSWLRTPAKNILNYILDDGPLEVGPSKRELAA
jgi:uncharacterized protein (TIGR00661 family)